MRHELGPARWVYDDESGRIEVTWLFDADPAGEPAVAPYRRQVTARFHQGLAQRVLGSGVVGLEVGPPLPDGRFGPLGAAGPRAPDGGR